jgi:HSP20 family molecular chaperone IbpA
MEQEIPIRPVFTEPPYSGLIADVYETSDGDAYVIEIPVPGLKRDEIVVKANNYSLSVAAEPQPEPSSGRKDIKRERSLLPISRIFESTDGDKHRQCASQLGKRDFEDPRTQSASREA